MLASKLCRTTVLNKSITLKPLQVKNVYRTFAEEGRDAVARAARRRQTTLKEKLMGPEEGTGRFIQSITCKYFHKCNF